MFGTILFIQQSGGILGSVVDPGYTERARRHILLLRTGSKCSKTQDDYMPVGHTQVRDFGGVGSTAVHGKMVDIPRAADNTDPLSGLQSRTCHGINEGSQIVDAWYRT